MLNRHYIYILSIALLGFMACSKSNTNTNPSTAPTMSATINGSNITFTTTLNNSNGVTIVTGVSSRYTLTIYLKTVSASIFTLADPSTGYYATLTDGLSSINYSTDPVNTGQITLTQSGIRFNGTFYFTGNETSPTQGGGNISVTSGSCSNI